MDRSLALLGWGGKSSESVEHTGFRKSANLICEQKKKVLTKESELLFFAGLDVTKMPLSKFVLGRARLAIKLLSRYLSLRTWVEVPANLLFLQGKLVLKIALSPGATSRPL